MNNFILYTILLIIGMVGTYAVMPLFKNLLTESGVERPNYKQEIIPVSMGIVFLPMMVINSIILIFFTKDLKNVLYVFIYMFGVMSMFFAGIMDDVLGNRDVSGLKGHFKSLMNSVRILVTSVVS